MKTIVYKNYDENCPYIHVSKDDPFANCINPAVFNEIGINQHWVVNCKGCPHKHLVDNNFGYKAAILGIKLEETYGNGSTKNGRRIFEE